MDELRLVGGHTGGVGYWEFAHGQGSAWTGICSGHVGRASGNNPPRCLQAEAGYASYAEVIYILLLAHS